MENKRKIPKRIYSFFLAILCTFGILFVSYMPSFADSYSFSLDVSGYSGNLGLYTIGSFVSSGSGSRTATLPVGTPLVCYARYGSNYYYYAEINGVSTSGHTSDNPVVVPYSDTLTVVFRGYSTTQSSTYFLIESPATPTPEPTPTPTPAPATPTPNPYGPGPVPTIPPGEQSYTDFFSRLASDAQSAFNAIFLSWNNANSRFYSGIFFIGFPILLGIIGLVASIFFGDDD